jgi:hypothetical protein
LDDAPLHAPTHQKDTGGDAPGGTYGGVAFTSAEECKAIDSLNYAKGSELSGVLANIPYDCAPDVRKWTGLWLRPVARAAPLSGHRDCSIL